MLRTARVCALLLPCLLLANCARGPQGTSENKYGVSASARVVEPGQPVPKGGGAYRIGKPYVIGGRTYVPEENTRYKNEGMASWYGDDFHGRLTANGEVFDMNSISAAHPTLPMPSYVRVTNLKNQKSIVVRVNDRGPYERDREIDLSKAAAKALDFHGHGLTRVRVEYVGKAPLAGSDDRKLLATLRERGEKPRRLPDVQLAETQAPTKPAPRQVQVAAADRDFAPEFFDATPMTKRGGPIPAERSEVTTLPQQDTAPPSRIAASDGFESRYPAVQSIPGPSTARPAPVSAYAAPRYDGAAGVMNGRGLY